MTPGRDYPSTAAGPFPAPPRRITDADGREIRIETLQRDNQTSIASLVDMYDDFDPGDRAQGLPPIQRSAIEEWLELILDEDPDVVARHGDRVVGHATLVSENEDEYELAIFVHQAYRGVGVGTTLLRTLLGAAVANGIRYVWLTVERWNTIAVRLYESVGFEGTGGGNFETEMTLRLADHTASTG